MSGIDEYRASVRIMTYQQLIQEKDRWKDQQSNAIGEYGYWGGINGEEIIKQELKKRTGKKYEILKPFVDETGKLWTINETLLQNQIAVKMPISLEHYGFIKELKESKSQ